MTLIDVKIIKRKKEIPTVVLIEGRRYILEPKPVNKVERRKTN